MTKVVRTVRDDQPGRYVIQHPDQPMSNEQRAWEMWAVHPQDLVDFGYLPTNRGGGRERFYLDHLKAAQRTPPEDR